MTDTEDKETKSKEDNVSDDTLLSDGTGRTDKTIQRIFDILKHFKKENTKTELHDDERCQNVTRTDMFKEHDGYNKLYNYSGRTTNNAFVHSGSILKLELWEDELKIVVQIPTSHILRKISYDSLSALVSLRANWKFVSAVCCGANEFIINWFIVIGEGRLKSIETAVESVRDIRKDLLPIMSLRELEISIADIVKSQKQLETSSQALSDLFDDVNEKSNKD
ncbi:unnamed protein product [Mytilus coruscus]|uniref:Uncharacterized protein n=1 Tax=Mytilus coruscus TaxID=42192 RepID=A0A6J8CCC0_MYTCO|nr:unnamed protein product [Mytilus coruscus]